MRIAGLRTTSLFDNTGINFVIFFQGCPHHCENCQNQHTWDVNGGYDISFDAITDMISEYEGFITGVTFSGGEPMLHKEDVFNLAMWCKHHGLQTTLYTGYNFDDLNDLEFIDYVIDGHYEMDKPTCKPFRGSDNQKRYKKEKDQWILID